MDTSMERKWHYLWLMLVGLAAVAGSLFAETGYSYTHSYINHYRSSHSRHVFISQAIDGEYGTLTLDDKNSNSESDGDNSNDGVETQTWQGYGMRTALGLELMKFVQFTGSHTFLNLRSRDDSLENLRGSRFQTGARLVFGSPAGNLELGGGAIVSRYDYQKVLENSDFYGSGTYYSIGMNYFMSSQISLFGHGVLYNEHLVRNGGSASVKTLDLDTRGVSFGLRLWL